METGRSYQCFSCQYLIHEQCAALPATAGYHHHHHHPLSLAFYLPIEYIKFNYVCDVCNKDFFLNSWVYHCELCRFVAHIKCAIRPSLPHTADEDANEADSQGLIRFPISEAHEEIIKPFVMRERGEMGMPRDDKKQYWFSTHRHRLSLVSSSLSEINDDDDDDRNYGQIKAELVCEACTMPIFQKHKNNPLSSSSSSDYMSCGECKYSLHLACCHLPPELPSHPLHEADHKLILKTIPEDHFWDPCSMCGYVSNGVFYSCTKCEFKADIKCACLPNTIQHEAHPHHHLHSNFISLDDEDAKKVTQGFCPGCRRIIYGGIIYKSLVVLLCGSCLHEHVLCADENSEYLSTGEFWLLMFLKAVFVPQPERMDDTSYFVSRYNSIGMEIGETSVGSDSDSSELPANSGLEKMDECGDLAEFDSSPLDLSLINFSFKNLSSVH